MMKVSTPLLRSLVALIIQFVCFFLEIIIGFEQPTYTVLESGGQQPVCAVIVSGNLRTTVAVEFNTADGDATGKFSDSLWFFKCNLLFS